MITLDDLRNPKRKSGFDHVNSAKGGSKPGNDNATWEPKWRAEAGRRAQKGIQGGWRGPTRSRAEEAAQDYLDYINAQQKILTIEDIRNPKRQSGFAHVGRSGDPTRQKIHWRAEVNIGGGKNTAKPSWLGSARSTPEEAAQDYCDYINGLNAPSNPKQLKSAGHEYDIENAERDEEVEAALGVLRDYKAQKAGRQGFVYLIVEIEEGGELKHGKIGYSVNPRKRVAELQTGNPRVLKLLGAQEGTPADERAMHQKYIEHNLLQEWFSLTDDLLLEFTEETEDTE